MDNSSWKQQVIFYILIFGVILFCGFVLSYITGMPFGH